MDEIIEKDNMPLWLEMSIDLAILASKEGCEVYWRPDGDEHALVRNVKGE